MKREASDRQAANRESNEQPATKVARFRHGGEQEELARLRRLTGLDFTSVPESLLGHESIPAANAEAGAAGNLRTLPKPAAS